MCGIAGFWGRPDNTALLTARAKAMADAMLHRGPDGGDAWADGEIGIGLGHRRLAIVDLSAAGHQPMTSACGRFVIVYNGEVYNGPEMRAELASEGVQIAWRGHSDTEVILEACAHWGVQATAKRLIGMFAFALWDRSSRTLWLGRDRFGIKPVYYGRQNGSLLFTSELKALRQHPDFAPAIDRNSLASYLRFNHVPAPHSIYRGMGKLPGGCLLRVTESEEEVIRFWDLRAISRAGAKAPRDLSDAEAEEHLHTLLMDAVGRRMVADVPLGAFLSGGIDSSTVVALMQAQSTRPVKTFTIGFDVDGYDESTHAAEIARHLGTDHTELRVTPEHALAVIPRLPEWYDEPFADSSQIPTFLVSELARRHVTVSLSGDGGDELFAGYERHRWSETIWRRTGWLPRPGAQMMAAALRAAPASLWTTVNSLLPAHLRVSHAAAKAGKLADILSLQDPLALYRRLVTAWDNPDAMVPGATEPHGLEWDRSIADDTAGMMETTQLLDALTYLPDDILTKVDRASMAVSLEARVPLLDHRVAEFAFSLPRRLRHRDSVGKWLLRQVLARHVPRPLFERPKMGFGIPVDQWLRTDLRDWAEDLLSERHLADGGYLDPAPIRAAWQAHLSGQVDATTNLWTILMFQAWRQKWQM